MSQTYIGVPTYTTSITIPNDGDVASAASVNNPTKSEADMDYFLLQSVGYLSQGAPISLYSTDLTTINISPVSLAIVSENGLYKAVSTNAQAIGIGQLEGGGIFLANTWYYIYIYSVNGVGVFQISTIAPTANKLYKATSDSHKYIGCFRTNAGAQILRFYAIRGIYTYIDDNTAYTGNSVTETIANTNLFVPPTTRFVTLHILYVSTLGSVSNYQIITNPGTNGITFITAANTLNDFTQSFLTFTDQNMRVKVANPAITLTLSVAGFME